MLIGHFGDRCLVDDLGKDRRRAFERARMIGGIVLENGDTTQKTRARSAELDVSLLHGMLLWAMTVRSSNGAYLLNGNPLAGVKKIREKNKKQPAATWERYEATVAAMQNLRADVKSEEARARWTRMEFALFLAERTGRRLGSIRSLRWEDFRFDYGVVHWRADADKKGYNWDVPMPSDFFETVRGFQRQLGATPAETLVLGAPRLPTTNS